MESVYVILFACYACYAYNRKSVSFVSPRLIEEGLDASYAGLIISCQNAAFAGSKFLVGVLSDRIDPCLLFASGLLVSGLTTLLFSFCSSTTAFCGLWFLNGLAQGCGWPSCAKIIRQRASSAQFGTLWSILSSGANVSGSLSPMLSAFLSINYGWRTSIFFSGITSITLTLISLNVLKESSNFSPNSSRLNKKEVEKTKDQVSDDGASSSTFKDLLKNPLLWLVSAGFLVVLCAKTTVVDWGQLYLMKERKRSLHDGSVFTSSVESGGFFGRILAGYLTDYFIRRQMAKSDPSKRLTKTAARMSVAVVFMSLSVAILYALQAAVKDSSSLLWILSIGFVLGSTLIGPLTILGIVASDSVPPHLSGSSYAFASLCGNVGAMISGLPFCYLASQYSWSAVLVILEFAIGATVCLMLSCWKFQATLSKRKKED